MTTTVVCLLLLVGGGSAKPVDFDTELIPIFTKAGCNVGACHGAAIGRGGFKLSLYGGDPAADYESIVRELEGRRINLADPESSLLVMKPTGNLDHGGGYRLDPDGAGAQRLVQWVAQGASRDGQRQLRSFRVEPQSSVIEQLPATVSLRAWATFSDGREEDVTRWTVFNATDADAVQIDSESAEATITRRGWHVVVARFLDRVVPLEINVPLRDEIVDLTDAARHNFVDDYVLEKLSTLRIPVSPPATDSQFVRRVYLDLTGRLPSPIVARQFLEDTRSDKRTRLVDQLLASEEFVVYWTYKYAKLLRLRPNGRGQGKEMTSVTTYNNWLQEQIRKGTPYNQMSRQLLTATGDSFEVGPANFYRTVNGPREQAEFISELLMGVRMRCANCHNHPLDRWTQDDYHGLAAMFARIDQGRVVKVESRGEVTHPRTGEAAVPRIPGERFLDPDQDGREALADWLVAADNPYFAKAAVNRLWKALMGRGLVEPSDDLRATNQPTHPKLLEELAEDFVQHGYQLRRTLRVIATSATYARSPLPFGGNEVDDRFYSHTLPRPLEAEVLADALADATDVWATYGRHPVGTRAITLIDPTIQSTALDILGRCSRQESCETPATAAGGLAKKLHMLNGPLINEKVTAEKGRLSQLLSEEHPNEAIVEDLYLRCLSRVPSTSERGFWDQQLATATTPELRRELLQDLFWSLLSCQEFVTNH